MACHATQILKSTLIFPFSSFRITPRNSLIFSPARARLSTSRVVATRGRDQKTAPPWTVLLPAASNSSSNPVESDLNSENDGDPGEIMSGEWPENFSLLNYDDLRAFLEPRILKETMDPSALLGEVMSPIIRTATVDQTLEEINHHFEFVSGLPVIGEQFRCIGVISKKDKQRAPHGLASKVGEVMSTPAITLQPSKTVLEAAALMLREKIHRIPIVNEDDQVVGMVTRTDIFKALEGLPA